MAAITIENTRGIGICVLWMALPVFLTAGPFLLRFAPDDVASWWFRLSFLGWPIGMFCCLCVPFVAGLLHRSRGVGFVCGWIGGVSFFFLGFLSIMTMALST